MPESIDASLVRVRTVDGGVVGAGFLVGKRQVLTCAHVIAQALGYNNDIPPDPPLIPVVLDFPLLAPHTRLAARVVRWCPVSDDGSGDIAGLEMLGDPPDGARIVYFAIAEDVWDHPFHAFGFPRGYDDGVWATGQLLGRQATHWLQIEDVKTPGFAVMPGFSGGPAWDTQLHGVVGMVVASDLRTETKAAFVIPFDVLAKEWPCIQLITHPRIFLSAAPADQAFAEQLRTGLQARGVVAWDELHGPVDTATDGQERVRQAIRSAQAVLLVTSSQTRISRTVKEHLLLADLYQRRLIQVWKGDDEHTHPQIAGGPDTVVDARNTPYETALKQIETALSQSQSIAWLESSQEEPEQAPCPPRNPYKGLHPFTAADVRDFFGRERLVDELISDVATLFNAESSETECGRCFTIVGPSGSGKSSVVMAGLLSRLQGGALPQSEKWVYLEPMRPGKHPLETLVQVLKHHFPDTGITTLREDIRDDTTQGLHLLATQLVNEPGSRVVLLIDQLEELFTQTETEDERRFFIDLLLTAATAPHGPVFLLLTLRADFYDRPMQYPALSRLIQAHQRPVLPMDAEDLRATIERPAALSDVQLSFEGNLVGDLLFEMQGQVGALPLLQFTLDQLFERREGRLLTLSAYHEIGGVKGALSQHAEQTYSALPTEEHRHLARALFLRLIEPGITEQDTTRRRAALSEFAFDDPGQTHLMREVIDAFVAARLLTASKGAGTTLLEVSHEAVLREWKRIADWLHEARGDILIQQDLSKDTAKWEQHSKPRDRLYRGSRLKEVQAWARHNRPSEREAAFLRASAFQRTLRLMSNVVAMLVLLSLVGTIAWYAISNSAIHPDPTLVTTLQDRGPGSLRYCINENATLGKPVTTITFAPHLHGSLNLKESLEFQSGEHLTLLGPVTNQITISGESGTNANIHVPPGATVRVSHLNFANSKTRRNAFLFNEGTLTVDTSVISNNTESGVVASGGGIYNVGYLTVNNSTISHNTVTSDQGWAQGGGIYNEGKLKVSNSTFQDNKAVTRGSGRSYGGGIDNIGGTVLVNASTFSGNSASGRADSVGGGIENEGKLTVLNSTFVNNSTSGYGGGIDSYDSSSMIISFSTIYNNRSSSGGGIWSDSTNSGHATISSSLIAVNNAQDGPNIAGAVTSDGSNLIENATGAQGLKSTDRQVAFAHLGVDPTLRNNGGPTQTLALLPGSPAIDAVPRQLCSITITDPVSGHPMTSTLDQRGTPRLGGSENGCDIGAI